MVKKTFQLECIANEKGKYLIGDSRFDWKEVGEWNVSDIGRAVVYGKFMFMISDQLTSGTYDGSRKVFTYEIVSDNPQYN